MVDADARVSRREALAFTVTRSQAGAYVSRGGEKLAAALDYFELDVSGLVCADLGSHVGGFVDCLLQRGAARVYAVDTSYGTLAWKLRRDPRVVVLERTNAMHVALPQRVNLVTIDAGWTRQSKILPNVAGMVLPNGRVIMLVKPHYEAPAEWLTGGLLPDGAVGEIVMNVLEQARSLDWEVQGSVASPLRGHAGNREFLALLRRS